MLSTDNHNQASDEMKAGHLPAQKVGGRRVVNKKEQRNSESERAVSESSDESVKAILDSNLPAQLEKAYPPEAVRAKHEKPHAAREPIPNIMQQQTTVHPHQPRRHNH